MEEEGSQAMDLLLTRNSTHTHGYALYKNGQPIKLALFNYITDPSGANDAQVNYPQQLAEREGQEVRLYRWFNCTQVQSHVPNHQRPIQFRRSPTARQRANPDHPMQRRQLHGHL